MNDWSITRGFGIFGSDLPGERRLRPINIITKVMVFYRYGAGKFSKGETIPRRYVALTEKCVDDTKQIYRSPTINTNYF